MWQCASLPSNMPRSATGSKGIILTAEKAKLMLSNALASSKDPCSLRIIHNINIYEFMKHWHVSTEEGVEKPIHTYCTYSDIMLISRN